MPKQRRLDTQEKDQLTSILQNRPNKKLLQNYIRTATGKHLTLRDINNHAAKLQPKELSFEHLIHEISNNTGMLLVISIIDGYIMLYVCLDKNIEVLTDDNNVLRSIYYQDGTMKTKFSSFPELLLIDATYKLNNLQMAVFLQLVVDGNGESEIISVFLVTSEDGETISGLLDVFKHHNPAWNEIQTVLSDKDFTERAVYKRHYPQACLQLCLFHVLRSMKREINVEKMKITLEQKNMALEIIQKLAYSSNIDEYNEYLEELEEANIQPVYKYFMDCWDVIKEEWVVGLKQSCHYSNHTNNRLESINQKFKQVIGRFSSLQKFFKDLDVVLCSLRQERDARITSALMKRPCLTFQPDSCQARFSQFLTPYAFQVVSKQIELSQRIDIPLTNELCSESTIMLQTSSGQTCVTSLSCTCNFFAMNQLPCRHVFALRKHLNLDLYFEEAVGQRWQIEFYRSSVLTGDKLSPVSAFSGPAPVHVQPRKGVLSVSQRYKVANAEAQKLAVLTSEASMEKYRSRLLILQSLVQIWEQYHEVTVCDSTVTMNNSLPIEEPGALQEGRISEDQRLAVTDSGKRSIGVVECKKRGVNLEDQDKSVDLEYEEIIVDLECEETGVNLGCEETSVDLECEEIGVNLECKETSVDLECKERDVNLECEEIDVDLECKRKGVEIVNIKASI